MCYNDASMIYDERTIFMIWGYLPRERRLFLFFPFPFMNDTNMVGYEAVKI